VPLAADAASSQLCRYGIVSEERPVVRPTTPHEGRQDRSHGL